MCDDRSRSLPIHGRRDLPNNRLPQRGRDKPVRIVCLYSPYQPGLLTIKMAEKIRLSTAPAATVEPIAFSTGDWEKDSRPKPSTVEALANSNEVTVRSLSCAEIDRKSTRLNS